MFTFEYQVKCHILGMHPVDTKGKWLGVNTDYGAEVGVYYYMNPVRNVGLYIGPVINFGMGKYEETGDVD